MTWDGTTYNLNHVSGSNGAFDPLRLGIFLSNGSGSNYSTGQMCTLSDDGRAVAYPQEPIAGTTIKSDRRVSVSSPGRPVYIRYFDTFTNPTGSDEIENLILFDG